MTIALWQAICAGVGLIALVALIDLVKTERRRARFIHDAKMEQWRRFGMGKMKEIPAPGPVVTPPLPGGDSNTKGWTQ